MIDATSPHRWRDTDHESRYFAALRELAEGEGAGPGEEFHLQAKLVPATDYFGAPRAILIRSGIDTLGVLEAGDVDAYWPVVVAATEAGEEFDVLTRIWTCRDWDDFYASTRVALTEPETLRARLVDEALFEVTEEHWRAHETYRHEVDEPWLDVPDYGVELDDATPAPSRSAAPATVAVSEERWVELLSVPGGERATPLQRGYVRGSVGRASGNTRCRRLDFITKPQCEAALAEIGADPAPLYKGGRDSMGLWWFLMALLGLTVLLFGIAFPPLLVVTFAVGVIVVARMIRSRRRLRESWPRLPEAT